MGSCSAPDCFRLAARDGWCWAHFKQVQRGGRTRKVKERPASPVERLREAAITYADAGDGDEVFRRADDNLRKAAQAYGRRGVGGRPATVEPERAAKMVQVHGVRGTARELGATPWAVLRALKRVAKQFRNSR